MVIPPYFVINVAVGNVLKKSALENNICSSTENNHQVNHANDNKRKEERRTMDPFRPFDIDLCVEALVAPKHSLLLNKYFVIKQHLLLITTEFEPQTDHLNREDFKAIVSLLKQLPDDWIVFYNRGLYSGASQPHKHVQFIPGIMASSDIDQNKEYYFPLPPIFDELVSQNPTINKVPFWNFVHSFCSIEHLFHQNEAHMVEHLEQIYIQLLKATSAYEERAHDSAKEGPEQFLTVYCNNTDHTRESYQVSLSQSRFVNYNLLFSKKWMLLVPRSRENYKEISCNSLAFLHGFFAKNEQELKVLMEQIGVDQLLNHVTISCE
jgi:ATP adenylyltransferase